MTHPTPATQHIAQTLLLKSHPPPTASQIFTEKVLQKPLFLHPTATTTSSASARPTSLLGPAALPGPVKLASSVKLAGSASVASARTTRRVARVRKKAHFLAHRKPRPLSAREKRVLGVYEIPRNTGKGKGERGRREYEVYEGLHRLWVRYMWEVLGLKAYRGEGGEGGENREGKGKGKGEAGGGKNGGYVTASGAGSLLASADFHGAEVQVVRSRCVGRVGVRGIVVRETKFTFVVVTRGDGVKTIPKEHTIFRFEIPQPQPQPQPQIQREPQPATATTTTTPSAPAPAPVLPNLIFELHGSQFENRAPDRATKKFKMRNLSDL
ncbi:hypothetical protein MMC16_001730 [Acarospora aff. strigata]|nr:hypothetical protein [Acarospora aff. strigata]